MMKEANLLERLEGSDSRWRKFKYAG